MSVNMSSFSPQSSGGGVYVLKLVQGKIYGIGALKYTFSAEYGGLLAISMNSNFISDLSRLTVDGFNIFTGNNTLIRPLYPFITWMDNNMTEIAMQIPFKESIYINFNNGGSSIHHGYYLYKYVLAE